MHWNTVQADNQLTSSGATGVVAATLTTSTHSHKVQEEKPHLLT